MTGKPFPTTLCLLINVGLLGFMDKQSRRKDILFKGGIYEVLLLVCVLLSYSDRAIYYFIAYNLGFITYYLFKHVNINVQGLEILGKLGFTFFLGASIPMKIMIKIFPSIADTDWYYYVVLQFFLTFIFSYVLTQYCERPLLALDKKIEATC